MNQIIKFIRSLIKELKNKWIIEIRYPMLYPSGQIKSIIPRKLLLDSKGLFIEEHVLIKNPLIEIGKHTYIGNNTIIDSCVKIGNFCSISLDVKIGLRDHPLHYISTSPVFYSKYRKWVSDTSSDNSIDQSVIIEDDVLISANAIILNGVKIGRGAVIGAGAIVTKNIPSYAIVAGIPAKVMRYRFSEEMINKIEESKWWELNDSILKSHIYSANNPKTFINKINSK